MDFRHLAEVFLRSQMPDEWLDESVALYRLPDFEIHVTWEYDHRGSRIADFKIYEVGDNEE